MSDVSCALYNKDGLDVESLRDWIAKNGVLKGYPNAEERPRDDLIFTDVDVLIPAALGGIFTKENAADIRAKLIVEAANAPTTPEADEIFEKRGSS